MDAKQPSQKVDSRAHTSPNKESSHSGSQAGPQTGSQTGATRTLAGSVAGSARNMALALDPRRTSGLLGQLHSLGSSSPSSSSSSSSSTSGGSVIGSSSKATTSAASRTFQHASNAIETLGNSTSSGSSSNSSSGAVDSILPTGFRGTPSFQLVEPGTKGASMMDWDGFLSSSESTLEDQPYKPPSIESFGFSSCTLPEQVLTPLPRQQAREHHPEQQDTQSFESIYQTHLSQSMDLTPTNHTAFLDYLRSTANSSAASAGTQANDWRAVSVSGVQPVSKDIQRQQLMDGGEVVAFLESNSYSDFVDQMEAQGIDKRQQDRRTFVYSEATLGPQTQSLFSALQLIQHLPSERQDVVQYLLQQGTYSDDVWGRPFAHDTEREEAASLAATRTEQDQFLQQAQQQSRPQGQEGASGGEGATTEEMEHILRQIVQDANTEVKTGETNGKALSRLMTVRSRITMARL